MDWNRIYVFLYANQRTVSLDEYGIFSRNAYPCVHCRNCVRRRNVGRRYFVECLGWIQEPDFSIGFSVIMMGVSITISGLLPPNAFIILRFVVPLWGYLLHFTVCKMHCFKNSFHLNIWDEFFFARKRYVLCYAAGLTVFRGFGGANRRGKVVLLCGIGIIIVAVLVFTLPILRNFDCQSNKE